MEKRTKLEVLEEFLSSFEEVFPDHDDYDIDDDMWEDDYVYHVYVKHLNDKGEVELKRLKFTSKVPINVDQLSGVLYKQKLPEGEDIISFKLNKTE